MLWYVRRTAVVLATFAAALTHFVVPLRVATAQTAPRAIPDGMQLRPGVDSLAMYLIRGTDTTQTGMLRDELTVLAPPTPGAPERLQRVYVSVDRVFGSRVDTIVDARRDLQPITFRSVTDRGQETIDFRGGRATGWLRLSNADSVAVDVRLPATGAFNASSFDLVLRAAPLRAGWTGTVPGFIATSRAVTDFQARVTGTEVVDGEPCWRVQAEFGGTPVTFWIGTTTRVLRQQVMQVRPDVQILFRHPGGRTAPSAPIAPRTT